MVEDYFHEQVVIFPVLNPRNNEFRGN